MRRIEVLDQLFLQFPGREAEFDVGVEVGALTVLMAQNDPEIRRTLSADCIEQLRPLAEKFGYALVATAAADGLFDTCLSRRRLGRPHLRLV